MREFEHRGTGVSFGGENARAIVSDREPARRSPDEEARAARTMARNIEVQAELVKQYVAMMEAAASTGTPEDWTAARSAADTAVAELERQVSGAVAMENKTANAEIRQLLADAADELRAARALVAQAPATPHPSAPVLGCGDALLAILPPDHPVSPAEPVYAAAEAAVARIIREQITYSDITALRQIVRRHKDHPVTRRFSRFGQTRQGRLLGLLDKDDVRQRARAREAVQRRTARNGTAASRRGKAQGDAPMPRDSELANATPATATPFEASGAVESDPADLPAAGATDRAAAPPEAHGVAIAARVPGVSYQGTGVFRVTAGHHQEDAAVQRVGSGVSCVRRRGAQLAVVEIVTGLDNEALMDAVAEQLRALQAQLVVQPATVREPAADEPRHPSLGASKPAHAPSVQRKAIDGEADLQAGAAVGAAAARGVDGPGGPLPHLEQIRASFGHHDVTGVQAHQGPAAAGAARDLGATAYAFGNSVAFHGAPDLHTAAHEAAHVVQQRGGVQLKDGMGRPGDAYERHADAVADAVAAGRPAEQLLDQVVSAPSTGVQHASVQRSGEGTENVGATNPIYVNENRLKLIGAIMDRIEETALTQPHPRLRWRNEKRAKEAIALAISAYIRSAPEDITLKRMMMLSYPVDLLEVVDQARRGPAGSRLEAAKLAVATPFDEPIVASLTRMGTRAVVQLDAHPGDPITGASVVGSCPLDGVVAELLVDRSLIDHVPRKKGDRDDTGGKPFLKSLRAIAYEWQGARDPNLWNWIKVTSPADATVEEVADTFNHHEQAYRIAASPPYFGIPFEIARDVEQAHAPANVQDKLATGPGPRLADPSQLGISAVSDEAAKAQAPQPSKDDPAPAHALERVQVQLEFMNRQLVPWHASDPLAGATLFVGRRGAEFARDSRSAQSWSAALAAQERVLFAAASELTELLDEIARAGAKPADVAGLQPVMCVLHAYAHAGGVSHLQAEAPAALVEARRLRTVLPLALAEDRIHSARGDVVKQRQVEGEANALEPNADTTPIDVNDQLRRAADLRLQAAHGDKLDPDAIEQLSVDASETSLRARLVTLATQAHAVMRKADDVGLAQGRYPGGSWSVHMVSAEILRKVNGPAGQRPADHNDDAGGGWHEELDNARQYAGPRKGLNANDTIVAQRRDAIRSVSSQLDRFARELNLGEYLKFAYAQIADEQLRALIRNMALQIGIAVLTGEVIGAIGAAVRGISLAGEIGAELRGASLLYKGAEVLATATANTATQGALGGEVSARSLAENALTLVLTSAALRPFHGLLHDSAAVEGEIQTWGRTAGTFGRAAAELVIDSGASIGAAGVAHAMTHGRQLTQSNAEEWVTMGLSIAASKFVHQRTQGMHRRILEATRELKTPSVDRLLDKVAALEHRSNFLADQRATPEQAIELLVDRHRLLVEEQGLYVGSPKARTALTEAKADLAATGSQFAEVPLQLAHLSPIVEGRVYEGTAAEIERAFHTADATGVPLTREWFPDAGGWRVTTGDRVIEIHERGGARRADVESRAAHEVPGSNFTGVAPRGTKRTAISPELVVQHAQHAVSILDGVEGSFLSIGGNGMPIVSVGPQFCEIDVVVGDATRDVATHTYRHGSTRARITVSEEARPEDLTRAIAHELAEIHALMLDENRSASATPALTKGSKSDDLSHHDLGRKAELRVLLYELDSHPARRNDVLNEIDALLDHLGLDKTRIDRDARAKRLLGEDLVREIAQTAGRTRIWVDPKTLKISDHFTKGDPAWRFSIEAPLPDGRFHQLAFGDCPVDKGGQPISGPSYGLSKKILLDGRELRVSVGDGTVSFSLTDLAIQQGNDLFRTKFGHLPTELPGSLIEDNKAIFQKAYLAQLDAKIAPRQAAINAVRQTPFGRARNDAGYTEFEVKPFTQMTHIVYGDPPTVREVPNKIEIVARKK